MHNLLKNKLFIVLLLFLSLITIYTNVFASSISYNETDINLKYFDDGSVGFIFYDKNSDSYVWLGFWRNYYGIHDAHVDYTQIYAIDEGDIIRFGGRCHDEYSFNYFSLYYYDISSGSLGELISLASEVDNYCISKEQYSFVYSPHSVYDDSDYTTLTTSDFFYQTPQGITQTLVEETMKAQVMEQLKKMIVGFLKYLTVFVISLLAFWKGWKFLSMQLRKA